MKIAFLFAGQGSQKAGMGKDFYENRPEFAEVLDAVSLDFDLKELMFHGPEEQLSQTRYTQPCMAAFAAGVTAILAKEGIVPSYVAGLSLGEYSALHAAGVFDAKTLIELVAFRGKAMEEAAHGMECKMSAVMGLESDVLQKICDTASAQTGKYVTVSNFNCTGQYVICGEEEAVAAAELLAKADSRYENCSVYGDVNMDANHGVRYFLVNTDSGETDLLPLKQHSFAPSRARLVKGKLLQNLDLTQNSTIRQIYGGNIYTVTISDGHIHAYLSSGTFQQAALTKYLVLGLLFTFLELFLWQKLRGND